MEIPQFGLVDSEFKGQRSARGGVQECGRGGGGGARGTAGTALLWAGGDTGAATARPSCQTAGSGQRQGAGGGAL